MGKTNISWATHTWNITAGCTKVSEGCRFCWAERMARRLKSLGRPEYQDVVAEEGWTGKVVGLPEHLDDRFPSKARVFVNSMSDLFHPDVPAEFVIHAFEIMSHRQDVDWVVLTKRPQRMVDVLFGEAGNWYLGGGDYYPNIWIGVSAEDQRTADERVPLLHAGWLGTCVVSVEPMLEPVDLTRWIGVPQPGQRWWVICGGESGPDRRLFDKAWARDLMRQCKTAAMPFFGKQASALRPGSLLLIDGGEVKEWPR